MLPAMFRIEPVLWPMLILLATIYIIPRTSIPQRVEMKVQKHIEQLPDIRIDFHPSQTLRNRFSTNKTALYIETRNEVTHVTPLLLHMTQIIPPEWRFVFLGTESLIKGVNRSAAVHRMVQTGKLRLEYIERWTNNWKVPADVHETHSRLLTNITFYDEQLPGVEWLLNFRSSAIVCASANRTVNDYLDYDWVGAPWNANDNFGGNGGLSLRRLSKVRQVLKFQTRQDGIDSEDRWMSRRLGLLPGANCANATIEKGFSVEDIWSEQPLGYHINPTLVPGSSTDVWDNIEKRREIYRYCPEIKMIMHMRLERERCPEEVVQPVPDTLSTGSTSEQSIQEELKKATEDAVSRWREEQIKSAATTATGTSTVTGVAPLETNTVDQKEFDSLVEEQILEYNKQEDDQDEKVTEGYEDNAMAELDEALREDALARAKSDAERAGSKANINTPSEHWVLDGTFDEQRNSYDGIKMLHDM